jgi:hypothetical protein
LASHTGKGDGGFTLAEATPLEQFPWSGHLELVALLER